MRPTGSFSRWRQWFELSRLIPLLTVLCAGVAITLSLLKIITLSTAEEIIIALLALLAADALSERLNLLARIETKLNNISLEHTLRGRADILPVEVQAAHASEICILAACAITLLTRNYDFFQRKIKDGCNIRLALLDPDSPSVQTLNLRDEVPVVESDIRSALEYLKGISQTEGMRGNLEVRLLNVFLPYSMFAVDLQKETGSMVVEYHAYKTTGSARPHVFLTREGRSRWFSFYAQQFEQAWSNASIWNPSTSAS